MARLRFRLPRAVKRITNPVVGRVPIWIASGPNKGLRWSLASAGSGYGSGKRESAQLLVLSRLLQPGDAVWDVGAHYGFITLFASRRVTRSGQVHAFEPSAASRWFLQRHVHWNNLANVTIHPYALGAFDGCATFGGGTTSKQHRIGGGAEEVQVKRVQTLLETRECGLPTFLKIDVEGAEGDLLRCGIRALDPTSRLLLAVHSEALYHDCAGQLASLGYRLYESARLRRYRHSGWHGDADLVALGRAYPLAERDLEALEEVGY